MTRVALSNAANAHALLKGLTQEFGQKTIPTSYIYSLPSVILTEEEKAFFKEKVGYKIGLNNSLPSGAGLFAQITHDPDYYVGKVEDQLILRRKADKLFKGAVVTEFGPGDGTKTLHYLNHSKNAEDITYQAIDVSEGFLTMTSALLEGNKKILNRPVTCCADFFKASVPFQKADTVLFLGTTVSNFDPTQTQNLLETIRNKYIKEGGFLLLGQDGNQDKESLNLCYDDRHKNTAAFVMNGLRQIRRDFLPQLDLNAFEYEAHFQERTHTMRMGIRCLKNFSVSSDDFSRISFAEGEFIQVGQSRKYPAGFVGKLLAQAGFKTECVLSSAQNYNLHVAQAIKGGYHAK